MTASLASRVPGSFADVERQTRDALAAYGFGVITEIDVEATMRAKLGEDVGPFRILGACNPALAFRALTSMPAVGLLLPCNVVVRQDGDAVLVEAVDPEGLLPGDADPEMGRVAAEASALLRAALAMVDAGAAEGGAGPSSG